MNILVIEDDFNLAELLSLHLRELPAKVTVRHQGWEGLDEALSGKYDFLVLDLTLPGLNGMEICRRLQQQQIRLPLLMLTSRDEEHEKIAGLEMGADDYMTKPFSPAELIARVNAILRRVRRQNHTSNKEAGIIERGDLKIDPETQTVFKGTTKINLTAKEFQLLHFFMLRPGRAFSRQELLDKIWGEQFEGLEHTVNVHINRLRVKVEDDIMAPRYILTAWGIGYRFNDQL